MSGIEAVSAVSLASGPQELLDPGFAATPAAQPATGFADMLMSGLRAVDGRVETADALVRQFAIDDSIPVHQVTIALEQARMSVELAMQVRTRLVEGYRELMNMQL